MKLFINNNREVVKITDENGKLISVRPNQRLLLPDHFDKYVKTGHLSYVRNVSLAEKKQNQRLSNQNKRLSSNVANKLNNQTTVRSSEVPPAPPPKNQVEHNNRRDLQRYENSNRHNIIRRRRQDTRIQRVENPNGKRRSAKNKFHGHLKHQPTDVRIYEQTGELLNNISISNNIGVGILSYNRPHSLQRLINSILKHTNLNKTTIFLSDDNSTNPELLSYLDILSRQNKICVIRNHNNLGIAGNSNRLLQCLERFTYGIMLNDDVEILSNGWEYFYCEQMERSGLKHLIFRQPGVYGAELGSGVAYNGVNLLKSHDKPQGAILAFDSSAIESVGYFDESYGAYGMEHVDWSTKFYELKQNPIDGYYDAVGSHTYFKLHDERSEVDDRLGHLKQAKEVFANRNGTPVNFSDNAKLKSISVVIPYRDQGRSESVVTVIENMRSQLFPIVNIYLTEHDTKSMVKTDDIEPAVHLLVQAGGDEPFNKSKAFNAGVDMADDEFIILHDADMIMPNYYCDMVFNTLTNNDGCHLGKDVSYYTETDTNKINNLKQVFKPELFERYVSYFEGGSLACTKKYYSKIGGFYEAYSGYGCEDCDFYTRLSQGGIFKNDRTVPLLHLWHPRSDKWMECHNTNLLLQERLNRFNITDRINDAKAKLAEKGYDTI